MFVSQKAFGQNGRDRILLDDTLPLCEIHRHDNFAIGRLREPDGPGRTLADPSYANIRALTQTRDILEAAPNQGPSLSSY